MKTSHLSLLRVESQRPTQRASANAAKSFSGATRKCRHTSTAVSSAIIACDFRQQPIELLDGPIPERLMPRDPAARLLQRRLSQAKSMNAPVNGAFNEPGPFQHFEVIGNSGLCGTELSAEFAGTAGLASRQGMNHGATGAVRQGAKGTFQA